MAVLLVAVALIGCDGSNSGSAPAAKVDAVMTTFYPTEYFASRISGGAVKVECPLPDDADPAYWQPPAEALTRYQNATLVVLNGANFENWVRTASLPFSRTCDTAKVFEGEFIKFEGVKHSHGAQGEHSHEGIDGHTWLDPVNAQRQAEQVLLAMTRAWPQHEKAMRDNFATLDTDLKRLDARLRVVSAAGPVAVLASHPAYNYLGRRYGWTVTNVDFPPDEAPTTERLAALKSALGGAPGLMLFEEAPLPEIATALEAMQVKSVAFVPTESLSAADRTAGRDYLTSMNDNIDTLARALGRPVPPK
ncbi:MAG: metal ABC transporter solute-binding protein, Zn/Mn family [Phycisphaerales bacterium]